MAASEAAEPGAPLTILIGSSGDAETDIVNQLVAEWSAESGTEAEVIVASDLNQQLSQGFSSNEPPDLFYLSTDQMAVVCRHRLARAIRRVAHQRRRLLSEPARGVHL